MYTGICALAAVESFAMKSGFSNNVVVEKDCGNHALAHHPFQSITM
jgi:hypothetical protein